MSDYIEKGFCTIDKNGVGEFTEKKSRFIGFVRNTDCIDEFDSFLDEVKAQYPDATHHVWAYRIFTNNRLRELYSDDGEPSLSSGPPALRVLAGDDLINVSAVIVRYYGGTKLGVGGLVRAYSHSVKLALENTSIIKKVPADIWEVSLDYSQIGHIENFLGKRRGEIVERDFSEHVKFKIVLAAKYREDFERFLTDLTRGKGIFDIEGVKYVIWS